MIMDIDCPYCNKNTELDCDVLPSHACDDVLWECPECEREMKIGWYAEAEVRQKFSDVDFDG